jgi:hypothetical protein
MNTLESQSLFRREDAVKIVASLAESGVYANMVGSVRGWKITLNGHTDLITLAKVLDTCEVKGKPGIGACEGTEPEPVNALYRPYGGEGWPDVIVFWGSKP